jgi:hypothetical protein
VDFLDSEFIVGEELPTLLKAAKEEGAVILPVVVTPCNFRRTRLSQFQSVNDPTKPLSLMPQEEHDVVWEKLVEVVLDTLAAPPQAPPPPVPPHPTPGKLLFTCQGHTFGVWGVGAEWGAAGLSGQ